MEVHGGDELERFEGSDGRVGKVVTKAGLELDCDMVVVGAGVMPDVMLARSGGLELGESGGVKCSSGLETSVPGIYAAGDMCEYDSPIHDAPLRVEHWDVAFNQGKTAALNMLGRGRRARVRALLLLRPGRLGLVRVRGPGLRRAGRARLAGRRQLHGVLLTRSDGHVVAALSVGPGDDLEHATPLHHRATKRTRPRWPQHGLRL